MKSCGMRQENEVPTQNIVETSCLCGPTKNKMHMFREYFLSLTASKLTKKVELTKKVTDKTSAILCRRYDNGLDAANLYSRIIKSSTKTCVFKDLG